MAVVQRIDEEPAQSGEFSERRRNFSEVLDHRPCHAERAYALAGKISAALGPGGNPTSMLIEVRQFAASR
jgi:hypothetical protein